MDSSIFLYVYENTSETSPLRQLITDQCAIYVDSAAYAKYPENFPKELLTNVVRILSDVVSVDIVKKFLQPREDSEKYLVDEDPANSN